MNKILPHAFFLPENERMPNNPGLPVLVYRKVFDAHAPGKDVGFQRRFEQNGWKGIWKNGLYDYHHFHPASHEALGVARGSADIELGGDGGKALTVEAGDLVVLPAGTGHRCLSASTNLLIIGAYPAGQENYSVCRHKRECDGREVEPADVAATIAAVALPDTDPMYGAEGPLIDLWKKSVAHN